MAVVITNQKMKMAKAIGDCSFFKRLFTESDPSRDEAIDEIGILKAFGYTILLPYPVLYCVMGTRFKKDLRNINNYNSFISNYPISLVCSESSWGKNINMLMSHGYGSVATPTLADMEVRTIILNDPEIDFLLTYEKNKYADLYQQVQSF